MSVGTDEASLRRVMIVEDDAAIAEGLALNLNLQGFATEVIGDGETARARIEEALPDLVLLDISLPKKSGIWVLENLRKNGNNVPVIVLSARQNEFDKVAALHLGADDYVTKPFALAELLARIATLLRRARLNHPAQIRRATPPNGNALKGDGLQLGSGSVEPILRFGDVEINLHTRTVFRDEQPIKLTHLEFELLSFLCQSGGRVFSREELVRQVWGIEHAGQGRTVDNFIAQLRAKLEKNPNQPKHLLTIRGSGYRFDVP
jgi:two-component system alkaline phosphatase synthesis response regulator PhoP